MALASAVNNEDRVTMAAAMYGGEASAEDYEGQVEDVMGGGGSGGSCGRGLNGQAMTAATVTMAATTIAR